MTLFAAIEAEQHEALRAIAFSERRSLADVVREALSGFISPSGGEGSETTPSPLERERVGVRVGDAFAHEPDWPSSRSHIRRSPSVPADVKLRRDAF